MPVTTRNQYKQLQEYEMYLHTKDYTEENIENIMRAFATLDNFKEQENYFNKQEIERLASAINKITYNNSSGTKKQKKKKRKKTKKGRKSRNRRRKTRR